MNDEKAPAKSAVKQAIVKHAAKKHAAKKHAAKKHAAKKHAAKKQAANEHAEKQAFRPEAKDAARRQARREPEIFEQAYLVPDNPADESEAFHHLRRAAAVISLLEPESGGDLRSLLEHGISLYRAAQGAREKREQIRCAAGLLRAAEHLGMAGLYAARSEYRVEVESPARRYVAECLETLGPRLDRISPPKRKVALRLLELARELLRRAEMAGEDGHLEYELTMAADGICSALEAGL